MDEGMAKKFTKELTACLELLMMFNQAMNRAMENHASSADPLLNEILPNINEIHQRVKDLKVTINDEYVLNVISYIEEYCEACKIAFSDFSQVGECDLEGLNKLAARGIPKREEKNVSAPQPIPQQPVPNLIDLAPIQPPPQQQKPQLTPQPQIHIYNPTIHNQPVPVPNQTNQTLDPLGQPNQEIMKQNQNNTTTSTTTETTTYTTTTNSYI
jgi:hypothetical protein